MPKAKHGHNKPYSHRQFIFGISIFWLVVWVGVLSMQIFGSVGLSLLTIDLDTVLAVVTLLSFMLSSYGALGISWIRMKYMRRGKT